MMKFPALRVPGVANIVAIASGKGGVGKTTVAVNLALALVKQGRQVGLFDADLYGPNVPMMMGVGRKDSAHGYIPVARQERSAYIPPLERFGLKMMSIGLVVGEQDSVQPDPRFAGHIIRQTLQDVLWGELDFLLLDMPPGTGEPLQTLLGSVAMDGVVVVTTPQDLSLLDSGRSLSHFRQAGVPILGIVENMSHLICPHCGEPVEVFQRSERDWLVDGAEVARLGSIPMDPAISQGIGAGHPLMQSDGEAPGAKAFQAIAASVRQALAGEDATHAA